MSKGMLGLLRLSDTRGPRSDLEDKLAGSDGHMWLTVLKSFLRRENPWPRFPTWRTIILGHHSSPEAYASALDASGCRISDWALEILKKVSCSQDQIKLELVVTSGADLGFTTFATCREIFERAAIFGLILCPAEVGPALREQYTDQPPGERLLIATEPITDADGDLRVFSVGRNRGDDQWLGAGRGCVGLQWPPDPRWVFLRRKP